MTNEERIKRLEQSFVMLTDLARNADERTDTLAEAQANAEAKLSEAQANTEAKLSALADAQIRTEDRLAELTVTVSGLATAMTTLADRMTSLTERMTELAEADTHTDQRLDALIDIISQGRQGSESNS